MAKIVTYEEQKVALRKIGEDIKTLSKLQPLLIAAADECRVSISLISQEGKKLKAGYTLDKKGTRELLVGYYKDQVKCIRTLQKKHHIEVDDEEEAVLEFADRCEDIP